MFKVIQQRMGDLFFKGLTSLVLASFLLSSVLLPSSVHAQELNLPVPGSMLKVSSAFEPSLVKGIKIDPHNPLLFEFLIAPGQTFLNKKQKTEEYNKLVKYFLAALTTPEKEMWVNLSPYEHNRIIAHNFGKTEMGRDMLAQDYLLKQLSASLVYPEDDLGKKFWSKIYERVRLEKGSPEIPVNTLNKVWIVPQSATVFEKGNVAMVVESHLKVMMEEDYMAMGKSSVSRDSSTLKSKAQNDNVKTASQTIREIIIPEIEREINDGEHFAQLRQMYQSMILASWFKQRLKKHLLSRMYVNRDKSSGVELQDPTENEKIFQRYIQAYKKGVYNYIKEEADPVSGEMIPRKYFSGGTEFSALANEAMGAKSVLHLTNNLPLDSASDQLDRAMIQLFPNKSKTALEKDEEQLATLHRNILALKGKIRAWQESPHVADLQEQISTNKATLRTMQEEYLALFRKVSNASLLAQVPVAAGKLSSNRSSNIRRFAPLTTAAVILFGFAFSNQPSKTTPASASASANITASIPQTEIVSVIRASLAQSRGIPLQQIQDTSAMPFHLPVAPIIKLGLPKVSEISAKPQTETVPKEEELKGGPGGELFPSDLVKNDKLPAFDANNPPEKAVVLDDKPTTPSVLEQGPKVTEEKIESKRSSKKQVVSRSRKEILNPPLPQGLQDPMLVEIPKPSSLPVVTEVPKLPVVPVVSVPPKTVPQQVTFSVDVPEHFKGGWNTVTTNGVNGVLTKASYYWPGEGKASREHLGFKLIPGLSVASLKYPLGTVLNTYNPRTGKKIATVVVHDTGPFVSDRGLDFNVKNKKESKGVIPVLIIPVTWPGQEETVPSSMMDDQNQVKAPFDGRILDKRKDYVVLEEKDTGRLLKISGFSRIAVKIGNNINEGVALGKAVNTKPMVVLLNNGKPESLQMALNPSKDVPASDIARNDSAQFTKGGIDFDPNYLQLNLTGQGVELPIPAGFEWLMNTPIRGFTPKILDIRSGIGFELSFFKGLLTPTQEQEAKGHQKMKLSLWMDQPFMRKDIERSSSQKLA